MGVEKVQFPPKQPKFGDTKISRKLRKSFVGHPSAILFLRISREGVFQQQPNLHKAGIYVMGEDGSNAQFVTEGLGPGWSPDGHRLVFYRLSKSHRHKSSIWVANADGTEIKEITDQTSMAWFPRWTQDGKIVFASDRDGRSAIYLLNSDGSRLQRLVYSKDSDFFSPDVSPDNKQLVVVAAQLIESRPREYAKPTILVIELDGSHQTRPIAEGSHPSILWVKN